MKKRRPRIRKFEFQNLEPRRLLANLVAVDLAAAGRINTPLIVSGSTNGTPSTSPSELVDPNVASSPFAGVVSILSSSSQGSGLCTGTAITPTHIISAGHCFDFDDDGDSDINLSQSNIFVNNSSTPLSIGISAVDVHPDYTGFNNPSVNDDVAIVTLSQALPSNVPIYEISRDDFSTRQSLFMVGYGRSGTGTTGFTIGASFTVKRSGQNVAAGVRFDDEGTGSSEVFIVDFDGPTSSTNTLGDGTTLGNHREVTIGGGDSGGSSFVWSDGNGNGQIESGELTLFGVNTFSSSLAGFSSPLFGSQAGGMVVSSYTDFIDSVAGTSESVEEVIGESRLVGVTDTFRRINFNRVYDNPVVIAGPPTTNGAEPANIRIRNVTRRSFEIKIDEYDYLDGSHVNEGVSILVIEAGTHEFADGTIITARNLNTVNNTQRNAIYGTSFSDVPIVLSQIVSNNDPSSVTTRLTNVTRTGFSIKLQEEQANDGTHADEEVCIVAIERGVGASTGALFDVGIKGNNVTHADRTFFFRHDFDSNPAFFADMQTINGGDTAALRYRDLRSNRTTIFVEEETSFDSETGHVGESVGYFAIERGFIRGLTQGSASPLLTVSTQNHPSRLELEHSSLNALPRDFGIGFEIGLYGKMPTGSGSHFFKSRLNSKFLSGVHLLTRAQATSLAQPVTADQVFTAEDWESNTIPNDTNAVFEEINQVFDSFFEKLNSEIELAFPKQSERFFVLTKTGN